MPASTSHSDAPVQPSPAAEAPRAARTSDASHPRPERWKGVLVALGAAGVLSVTAAWLLPRGPVTTPQALALLAGALVVGGLAGWLVRSRWSLAIGPLVFVAVYELRWLGVDGPMTDAPSFDSVLGPLVVALGRGWLAVLVLLPMTVATLWARRLVRPRAPADTAGAGRPGWIGLGLAGLAVVALAAALVRPDSTPAIVDADGEPVAGSISELTTIEIDGHEQALLLRGHDATDPVLLYLEGGPGGTGLGAMRLFGSELERDFVVVGWDQRATGKTYPALEPRETLTVDRVVADLIEVTDHLRARFDQDRIYLLGNSWGTTLAVLAAQQHPDRFHALIGTGQMVSQRDTDIAMFEQMIADAAATGDSARVAELEALGPPPFDDIADYAPLLVRPSDTPETEWPSNVLVSEYTLLEQVNSLPALVETYATLYPQLQELDFRRDVPRLDVPVYVVDGEDEDPARSELSTEWLDGLEAPASERIVVEDAGHRPHLQQPERFAEIMRDVLREHGG